MPSTTSQVCISSPFIGQKTARHRHVAVHPRTAKHSQAQKRKCSPFCWLLRLHVPSASPTGCPSSGCPTPLGSLAPQPPTGQGACLLEVHLPSVVPQNRQSLCPKAALWSSSFVSGSPSYYALSEVIWPSWTVLFPCCPWASQCWLPL